jgi:CrcB protein
MGAGRCAVWRRERGCGRRDAPVHDPRAAGGPRAPGYLPAMLFAVAAGGALGSVARYLLGGLVAGRVPGFPWATLLVNVSGSLLFGFLAVALAGQGSSPALRAGLTAGFCGGYTTFSAFSHETLTLLERGSYARAGGYAAASVLLCVAAAAAGVAAARAMR